MNSENKNQNNPEDPSNWILGTFYYNKNDKRIFLPKKREFMGWTINFANPYSILALFLLIAIFFIVDYYLRKL